MDIILASTSPHRRRLLERLQIPFQCISPNIDEVAFPGETAAALAQRLSLVKARSVAKLHPNALVIGSDQVATIQGLITGKPDNFDRAFEQLLSSSGRYVQFYTGVCLVSQGLQLERFHVELTTVHFRTLHENQIKNYLTREQPYDCAGSFKVEGLGISLFESITANDPTALEGLPLIALIELLGDAGTSILGS